MSDDAISKSKASDRYRYYVLGLLTLTYLFSYMDRKILSILIGDISKDFAERGIIIDDFEKGLLLGPAFGIFYATLGLPIAKWADRANRKNIVAGAISLWSAATAACAAATGFWSLFMARLMVGVGEAGGTAPSHSILSDYFRKTEISRAIAVFSLGTTFGSALALMGGSYIADLTNWRITFIAAAVPGLVIGLLIFLTVREPKRGAFEVSYTEKQRLPFLSTVKELLKIKPFVGTVIAHALAVMFLYILSSWTFPMFERNNPDMTKTQIGFIYGPALLAGGLPGMLLGGYLSDALSKRDAQWMGWVPAFGCFLAVPIFLIAIFSDTAVSMAIWMGIGTFLYSIAHAPSLGVVQAVVSPDKRATGAAFAFFLANLFGLIIGPPLAGAISDAFGSSYGDLSLNYSLAVLSTTLALAGFGFLWTARQLRGFQIVEGGAHAH